MDWLKYLVPFAGIAFGAWLAPWIEGRKAKAEAKEAILCFFTEAQDGLAQSWKGEVSYVNPPYGRALKNWIKKAYEETKDANTTVVMLIPARTDTNYWHDYVMQASEVRFVRGGIKFGGGETDDPAPFPSVVVIFRGGHNGQQNLCGPYVSGVRA